MSETSKVSDTGCCNAENSCHQENQQSQQGCCNKEPQPGCCSQENQTGCNESAQGSSGQSQASGQENYEKYYNYGEYNYEDWVSPLKKIGLVAAGAFAMAQEEIEGVVKKCIEKGQMAQEESKKWMKDVVDKGRKQTQQTMNEALHGSVDNLEKVLGNMLAKMNIPKKSDLDDIAKRVDALNEKLESLLKNQTKES